MHARHRQRWVRLHRWLGLGLLAAWLLIGLSGSVLVLYREALNSLHGAPTVPATPAQSMPPVDPDAVLHRLRTHDPALSGGWRIEWPLEAGDPVVARYMRPLEAADRAFAPRMVWLDPAGQRVWHEASWGQEPFTWLYDLHYSLLMDRPGRHMVGALGLLMLVSLVSGLVLWWPRAGRWRQACSFKRGAAFERQVYDWHKLVGFGSAALLLMLSITGVLLTWHTALEPWLNRLSPLFEPPAPVVSGPPDLPLRQAVQAAQTQFPSATVRWVETPPLAGGSVRVQLWQPGEPSQRFPRTMVWLDGHTGEVRGVRDGLAQGAADTVMAWLHPLHNGEVAGWPGRILVLLCGLAPVALGLTGVWRWRHKRRASRYLARHRAIHIKP